MNVKPTEMTTHHQDSSQCLEEPNKTQQQPSPASVRQVVVDEVATTKGALIEEENGRERLKKHRIEMSKNRVWNIPDIWGQEELLKDWIDCSAFDDCLVPNGIMSAREALVEEGRRANSGRLRIENRC